MGKTSDSDSFLGLIAAFKLKAALFLAVGIAGAIRVRSTHYYIRPHAVSGFFLPRGREKRRRAVSWVCLPAMRISFP